MTGVFNSFPANARVVPALAIGRLNQLAATQFSLAQDVYRLCFNRCAISFYKMVHVCSILLFALCKIWNCYYVDICLENADGRTLDSVSDFLKTIRSRIVKYWEAVMAKYSKHKKATRCN